MLHSTLTDTIRQYFNGSHLSRIQIIFLTVFNCFQPEYNIKTAKTGRSRLGNMTKMSQNIENNAKIAPKSDFYRFCSEKVILAKIAPKSEKKFM